MEPTNNAAQGTAGTVRAAEAVRPVRRVGTFTFGVVLVLAGLAMLAAMFFPQADLRWALKLAPLALVSLGVETLLAARDGGRVRYDWVGMVLCCLIVCTALALFSIAWVALYHPDAIWYW